MTCHHCQTLSLTLREVAGQRKERIIMYCAFELLIFVMIVCLFVGLCRPVQLPDCSDYRTRCCKSTPSHVSVPVQCSRQLKLKLFSGKDSNKGPFLQTNRKMILSHRHLVILVLSMNPVHMKPSLQDLENWAVAAEEVGTASRILPGSGRLSTALTNHGPIYLLNV